MARGNISFQYLSFNICVISFLYIHLSVCGVRLSVCPCVRVAVCVPHLRSQSAQSTGIVFLQSFSFSPSLRNVIIFISEFSCFPFLFTFFFIFFSILFYHFSRQILQYNRFSKNTDFNPPPPYLRPSPLTTLPRTPLLPNPLPTALFPSPSPSHPLTDHVTVHSSSPNGSLQRSARPSRITWA